MKDQLTPRQKQIVRLITLGCTRPEIAAILGISPSTVDNHKTAALATLGVEKSVLLTRVALKYGITSMRDKLTRAERRKCKPGRGGLGDGWN